MLPELVGPIVYRLDITDVAGEFLAPYETRQVYIDLTPEEAVVGESPALATRARPALEPQLPIHRGMPSCWRGPGASSRSDGTG